MVGIQVKEPNHFPFLHVSMIYPFQDQFIILAEFKDLAQYDMYHCHSNFHHFPGNPVKKVILNQLERQVVTAAVAIVMKEDLRVFMAVGIILMFWMQAIMLWKGSHKVNLSWVHQVMRLRAATLLVSLYLNSLSMSHLIIVSH